MSARKIAFAAIIAAVYTALTIINPWSYGPIQFRISEVLCILPFFFPYSVWGLFVGCILANLISAYGIYDIVLGSLASLLAAYCTMRIGKASKGVMAKVLACLPPVVFNGLFIGAVIAISAPSETFWSAALTVALGEFGVLFALGLPAMIILPKAGFFKTLTAFYDQKIIQ
jgi:uncharacterized membrane protein